MYYPALQYPKLLSEFPQFAGESLPAMPLGFEESSWHNDTCPSFTRILGESCGTVVLIIFVEHSDPAQREFPDTQRFSLMQMDCGTGDRVWVVESDNWGDVLAYLESHKWSARCGAIVTTDNYSESLAASLRLTDDTCRNGKPFAKCTYCYC